MINKDDRSKSRRIKNRAWLDCELDRETLPVKKPSIILKTLGLFSIASIALVAGTAIYKEIKTVIAQFPEGTNI